MELDLCPACHTSCLYRFYATLRNWLSVNRDPYFTPVTKSHKIDNRLWNAGLAEGYIMSYLHILIRQWHNSTFLADFRACKLLKTSHVSSPLPLPSVQ